MFASPRIVTLVCLLMGAGLIGRPSLAKADLPGGAKIKFNRLFTFQEGETKLAEPSTDEEKRRPFNAAHCTCSKVRAGDSAFLAKDFAFELTLETATASVNLPAEVWVGTTCSTETNRNSTGTCERLDDAGIGEIETLRNTPAVPLLSVYRVLQPKGGDCTEREGAAQVWVGADGDKNGDLEYWVSADVTTDTQPPPLPVNVRAIGGEGAIKVNWELPDSRATDIRRFQFFCANEDGTPALSKPKASARYQTAKTLCGDAASIPFSPSQASQDPVPNWVTALDDQYLCGETDSATASEVRLTSFRNGDKFQVAMIAIDLAGNAAGVYVTELVTPQPVTDFWEDLHDQGSDAEGGFCLLARTFGDDSGLSQTLRHFRDDTLARSAAGRWLAARYYEVSSAAAPLVDGWVSRALAVAVLAPLVIAALLWHFLTLPGCVVALAACIWWRRRSAMRRRGALARAPIHRTRPVGSVSAFSVLTVLTVLTIPTVMLASAGPANAQGIEPYWDDDLVSTNVDEGAAAVRWHAGIRVGPYTPAIDAQFGMEPGPYQQMFGDNGILPMLDVDWILWEGFGQIGIGGSIGYLSKTARTYTVPTDGQERTRAAEKNSFRLIPMAATAVFRMTYLDDRYHIPIIPYVRGGLAYSLWWVEAPDGGVASVCRAGGATCDENKARGGSLGLVGSIGLAVRAERIDFEAASAMREGGIQHAGFYAELQASKVDDFGSGNKLSVGDALTWFAGVDFEF
jgi:hypothetical protein